MNYKNTKKIWINKVELPKTNKAPIVRAGIIEEAMKKLDTKGGFRVWTYLNNLAPTEDYTWDLMYIDIREKTGLTESTYHRGIQELIDKKFLIAENKKDKNNRNYKFFDTAQIEEKKKSKLAELFDL